MCVCMYEMYVCEDVCMYPTGAHPLMSETEHVTVVDVCKTLFHDDVYIHTHTHTTGMCGQCISRSTHQFVGPIFTQPCDRGPESNIEVRLVCRLCFVRMGMYVCMHVCKDARQADFHSTL